MRYFNLAFALISLVLVVACNSEKDPCSSGMTSAYFDLQSSFRNSYNEHATTADLDTFKTQLASFAKSYSGSKCTIDGIGVVEPTADINKMIDDFKQAKIAVNDKVVYGNDDRVEVSEATDSRYATWSRGVAAQISHSKLYATGAHSYGFISGTLADDMGVCTDERFADQRVPARCTGFLVAPDILVTAGHCVKSLNDCSQYAWVFGFNKGVNQFADSDIYSCSGIIAQHLTDTDPLDYAVIRLDRQVMNRTPLHFRTQGEVPVDSTVIVIGHPTGLPMKIGAYGKVRTNSDPIYFVTNLDTFGGNSGSPVIDPTSGTVEGILVRGSNDYITDSVARCDRVAKCSETGCEGEDVTRITKVLGLPDQGTAVNGQWGSWSSWSQCVSGAQSHSRICDNPAPANGGANCQGSTTESRHCLMASERDIMNAVLMAPTTPAQLYHSVIPVNRYSSNGTSLVGRKFLGLCGISVIDELTGSWESYDVANCSSESSLVRAIYLDFESIINSLPL